MHNGTFCNIVGEQGMNKDSWLSNAGREKRISGGDKKICKKENIGARRLVS